MVSETASPSTQWIIGLSKSGGHIRFPARGRKYWRVTERDRFGNQRLLQWGTFDSLLKKTVINGGDRTVEIAGNEDRGEDFVDSEESNPKALSLMQKIEALEQESRELVQENEVLRERVKKLKGEIERLENDKVELERMITQSEADKKPLESIAAKAALLETEVSRLQHDLITSMTEGEEANEEVSVLRRLVKELKKSDSEKGLKVEVLEKERNSLLEQLDQDAEKNKEAKAVTESKVNELEKKLEALEGRKSLEKSEMINVERNARAKIDEKDKEIQLLNRWLKDLDSEMVKNASEMERIKKEREELEIMKNDFETLLKNSEEKVREMEHKLAQLHKELEASELTISGLKNEALEGVKGKAVVVDGDISHDGEKAMSALKVRWPVLAASTGAIAAVAVLCYLRYARQR